MQPFFRKKLKFYKLSIKKEKQTINTILFFDYLIKFDLYFKVIMCISIDMKNVFLFNTKTSLKW